MKKIVMKSGWALAVAVALAGCGGGGDSGTVGNGGSASGDLTLRITDAPVDGATAVNITILSVELKRSGSESIKRIRMDGNGQEVNLMDYSGLVTLPLFTETVTSGEYQWARFELDDDATICFGTDPTADCEALEIPNNQEIKTSRAFSVPAHGVVEYVVDWDLRKSVVETNDGGYRLNPVLHLRPYASDGNITAGYIEGRVNGSALTNCASPAVYLFASGSIVDDIYPGDSVLTSVLIPNAGENDAGAFFLGSIEPGTYKLAFTCDAANDDLTNNDTGVVFDNNVLSVTVPSGGGATIPTIYPFESI